MPTNSVFDAKLFSVTMNIDIRNNINGYADKITVDSEETPEIIRRGTRKPSNRAIRRDATRKAKRHDLDLAKKHLISKQAKNRKGYDYVTEGKDNNMDRITYSGKKYVRPHNYLWSEDEEYAWDDMDALWDDYDDYKTFTRHWSHYFDDECPDGHWDTETQRFISDYEENPADNFDYDDKYIAVRQWDAELGDHVIKYYPNIEEYAGIFLQEKGLYNEFLEWLDKY